MCKVKALYDEKLKRVRESTPGEFVQLAGFKTNPEAGSFIQSAEKSRATKAQKFREEEARKQYRQQFSIETSTTDRIEFEKTLLQKKIDMGFYRLDKQQQNFFTNMLEAKRKSELEIKKASSLHFLIKGDVNGSIEAIVDAIGAYEAEF